MPSRFALSAVAALALAPAMAVAQTPPTPPLAGTRLDIVANGETKRVPDVAVIGAGVVTQAGDAASAMRDNAGRMAQVIAALKKAGVAERDIATSAISLSPQYRYGENVPPVITGYQAANSLSIRFRDVGKSGRILDTLVAAGVNQISGPSLQLDKPEAAEDEARIDAVKKARARAELYAAAAGLKVKRILSISESGGYNPPPVQVQYARLEMSKGAADTAVMAGEQSVAIMVSVSFELE